MMETRSQSAMKKVKVEEKNDEDFLHLLQSAREKGKAKVKVEKNDEDHLLLLQSVREKGKEKVKVEEKSDEDLLLLVQSDLDLAFDLQIEETLTESLIGNEDVSEQLEAIKTLELLNSFKQEEGDRRLWEEEIRRTREDLRRRAHDQKVAQEIQRIPEAEWRQTGEHYQKPFFGEGTSSSSTAGTLTDVEPFKLYFKGLFSDERVGDSTVMIAGVGAAVCDPQGNSVLDVQKPLIGDWKRDWDVKDLELKVEVNALVEALNAALSLDIKKIDFFVDYYPLFQYITMRDIVNQQEIAREIDQVVNLQAMFVSCNPFFVARNDVKFAFKLARGAIDSQVTRSAAESSNARYLKETCSICWEETPNGQMFSVDRCLHRYCYSCMHQHVEVKLLNGMVPQCPYERCKSQLSIDSCRKFLSPKLLDMMNQRMKEDLIPMAEKLYCPYPRCSVLMSKKVLEYASTVLDGANESGVRKCTRCHGLFCINCRVAWHNNMTCAVYRSLNPETEDAKVKSLAAQKSWRHCVKCNHIIELAFGCYHITCRCGHEFCYTCGAEWKNKKPTCKCRIWDERNIVHRQ